MTVASVGVLLELVAVVVLAVAAWQRSQAADGASLVRLAAAVWLLGHLAGGPGL